MHIYIYVNYEILLCYTNSIFSYNILGCIIILYSYVTYIALCVYVRMCARAHVCLQAEQLQKNVFNRILCALYTDRTLFHLLCSICT